MRVASRRLRAALNVFKDILPEGDFHLQEERRLFYVAITRAKTNLYLTWAKDYGGTREKKPSLFLVECGLVPSEKINKATGKVVFTKTVAERALPAGRQGKGDVATCPLAELTRQAGPMKSMSYMGLLPAYRQAGASLAMTRCFHHRCPGA